MDDNGVLTARMLGTFSLTWNDINIISGYKTIDSHFIRVMQVLIHYSDEGVTKSSLEELIMDDSSSDDVHHLLHSVIYNTRRKLCELGIPEKSCIEYRGGKYYWTSAIPVTEDAKTFESLCEDALGITEPAAKLESLLEAIYYYSGDFLSYQTKILWVASENKKYRSLFHRCVSMAAELLRNSGEYCELAAVGKHAARVCPLSEYELLTMEAYVSLGRYREAQELYEESSDYYQRELGIKAAESFIEELEKYAANISYSNTLLAEIQRNMLADDDQRTGGFFCTYPIFRGIYRMMKRSLDRCGRTAYLMLCTITYNNASSITDDRAAVLSSRMKNTICRSVRRSDTVCGYGKGQYLMLLINRTVESCDVVRSRIENNFHAEGYDVNLEFAINPVLDHPVE